MKKLFITDDTLSNKITYYHLLLFLIFLPFDLFYSEVILVSLGVHTIINLKKADAKKLLRTDVILLQGLFLLTLVSNFYAMNKAEGFSLLIRQSAIFIFPLLIFVSPINLYQYRSKILSVFSITCIITVLYLYVDAYRVIRFNHLELSSLFSASFINHNFSLPIGIHATYLSMYVALSLLHLLWLAYTPATLLKKLLLVTGIIILSAALIQLASRAVLISIVVTAGFIFPVFFLKKKRKVWYMAIAALVLLPGFCAIFYSDSFRHRYITDLRIDLEDEKPEYGISNSRMQRWNLAWQLVKKSPVIGYGSGDEVQLLREKYFDNHLYNAYIFKLNAHNQYLSFLIKSGIIGLLIYLFTLFYGFRFSVKNHDFIFLSFLIILTVVSLSENYLDVNKGIFFYAFFFSFFIASQRKVSPIKRFKSSTGNHQQLSSVSTY